MDIENLKKYIEDLELSEVPVAAEKKSFAKASAGSAAAICGGCLVGLEQGTSEQLRNDVANGILLAQLVSDRMYDRFDQADKWSSYYLDVIYKIGWSLTSESFTTYRAEPPTFRLDNASIGYMGDFGANPGALESLKKGSQVLAHNWGSRAGSIFESFALKYKSGNFQLMAGASDGSAVFGDFSFGGSESHADFFTAQWNSGSTNLTCHVYMARLDQNLYSMIRETVIRKIGDRADMIAFI